MSQVGDNNEGHAGLSAKPFGAYPYILSCFSSAISDNSVIFGLADVDVAEPQQVLVQDDMEQLLDLLPAGLGQCLLQHPNRSQLIEVHTAPLLRCHLITLPRIFRAVTCHVPSHMTSAS